MRKVSNRSHAAGFTVIEIITAVIVITMIVSLLLPALSYTQHASRTAKGLANLKEIGEGIRLYAIDNNGKLPWGYVGPPNFPDPVPPDAPIETDWRVIVSNYLDGDGGTYDIRDPNSDPSPPYPELMSIFRCPNASYPNDGLSHYSSHPLLMPDRNLVGEAGSVVSDQYRITRSQRPEQVILAMDGLQRAVAAIPYDAFATAAVMDGQSLDHTVGAPTFKPFFSNSDSDNDDPIAEGPNDDASGAANIRWRQLRGTAANFLFCDGHAKTVAIGQVTKRNIRIDN